MGQRRTQRLGESAFLWLDTLKLVTFGPAGALFGALGAGCGAALAADRPWGLQGAISDGAVVGVVLPSCKTSTSSEQPAGSTTDHTRSRAAMACQMR